MMYAKSRRMLESGRPRLTTSSISFSSRATSRTKVKTARPKVKGMRISRKTYLWRILAIDGG